MSEPLFMEAERVTFHPIEEDDLEFFRDLINHPEVREGLAATEPRNMADEREWFESLGEDGVQFCLRVGGERVGTVSFRGVSEQWGVAELAHFFHPDHWGNGYATEAVRRMTTYGFEERRLDKVWAQVFAFNEASVRVLEKAGFDHEATLPDQAFARGERVDIERYGALASEW
ncbi:GCN5-related N-acetyltransferase [Halosimplex carlsbadense 2-9-1]|uniref:GCN5-related N-acetyltransferase n=1 Tax=Halosimplex carlsbadense 2-9-1 TaxID=797114 RepID=M0CJ97_9EURY|nr:GNAT family N-acetyltransferase [Halosimplex carlsbadense]ELZ22698.1 GCN5-related N-acetyltransferase [Halosimplex carlsbadense 2-9-1]